jgi:hypothetical protein
MLGIAMDDEHLKDFYAGLAMLGVLSGRDDPSVMTACAERAFDIAERMMEERSERRGKAEARDRSDA